jgi:hypothetical protein
MLSRFYFILLYVFLQYITRHVYEYILPYRGCGWSNVCSDATYFVFCWKLYAIVPQVMNFSGDMLVFHECVLIYLVVTHEKLDKYLSCRTEYIHELR